VELLEGRGQVDGRATAYVCLAQSCKKPTSSPEELTKQLRETTPLPPAPPLKVR